MHATHHHMTKLGAARGDRTHPLEFAALMVGTPIILALTGASDAVIAVTGAFGFFSTTLNHSNLPLRSGVYGLFFTTAEMHHLHHSRDMDSSNSNYGCTIISGTAFSAHFRTERILKPLAPAQVNHLVSGPSTKWLLFLQMNSRNTNRTLKLMEQK